MIDLNVDARGLQQIALDLAATEQQATLALRSTLSKMAAWLKTQSVKGLSSELQLQQKIIRRRLKSMRLKRTPSGGQIAVWYGLNPIALIYLKAKQNKSGVQAMGGRFVKSGFIAKGKGGRQVFKRQSKARLPIEKQRAEVEDKSTAFIEGQLLGAAEFDARFFTIFERELKWRTSTLK